MEIYLHQYQASLFSEKIRLLLGYLQLPWHSVEINSIMPRPLLMPLTGGYRKTPSLQIGANVYCDTAVIAHGLARASGRQDLMAPGFTAQRVAEWADSQLFRCTVALNFRPEAVGAMMGQFSDADLEAFMKDRAELTGDAPMTSFSATAALAFAQTYLSQLDNAFAPPSASPFLFGANPCIADFSVYHCLWFLNNNPVNATLVGGYPHVGAWLARMAAFGHGQVTPSDGESALAAARAATPQTPPVASVLPTGLQLGDAVTVTPIDYGCVPVGGKLIAWDAQEVVVERTTAETGTIMTHFPNAGFEVALA